jgi:transposase
MAAQGGAVMAKPILDDALWEIIDPLLPPSKKRRKRYPGRKPIDNRSALCAILFVLKTGLPWEYLPQELGWGSGMTAWRRLHAWQRKGVWKKIHEALLAHLQEADQIDWSRAIVDSSSVRAMHGGKKRDPIQRIAANPAANITWSPTPRAFPSRPRSPLRTVMT